MDDAFLLSSDLPRRASLQCLGTLASAPGRGRHDDSTEARVRKAIRQRLFGSSRLDRALGCRPSRRERAHCRRADRPDDALPVLHGVRAGPVAIRLPGSDVRWHGFRVAHAARHYRLSHPPRPQLANLFAVPAGHATAVRRAVLEAQPSVARRSGLPRARLCAPAQCHQAR